jgi:hypothetical protein
MLARSPLTKTAQRLALVQSDMSGFIAFDFVLRLIFAGVMNVAFVIHVLAVHAHDLAADPAGFRIPAHAIADFESLGHGEFL